MEYIIDAKNKKLGRVATEAATVLMGKHKGDFARNNSNPVSKVTIINADSADINEKRLAESIREEYSGYPGGLKKLTFKQILEKKGVGDLFKNAVYGMLPKNKLRSKMIKNLKVTA